jgi:hypothetical protein
LYTKFKSGNSQKKENLGDVDIEGRTLTNLILTKWVVMIWSEFFGSGQVAVWDL